MRRRRRKMQYINTVRIQSILYIYEDGNLL